MIIIPLGLAFWASLSAFHSHAIKHPSSLRLINDEHTPVEITLRA